MTDIDDRRDALVDRLARQRTLDDATETALRAVPRHAFVPADRREDAYHDTPLPIGEGQTISAPHMVAVMTDLIDLEPGLDVLEIGTGCGYHAAVTAEIVGDDHVYTVEYHDELAESAAATLADLGYEGVAVRSGDGKEGWAAHTPYDRAYLTCAAPEIPDPIGEQVREGGVIVAPVGTRRQRLVRATVQPDSTLDREAHGGVRFVPLQ